MNIRRRVTLVLVAALFALVAVPAMADDGTSGLKFVPEDTMMVIGIDVENLKSAPLFKDLMTAVMSDAEAKKNIDKLKEVTGFDYEKDLSSLLIAVPPDVDKTENFLIVVKGKIDEKKFVQYVKDEGTDIKEDKHEGVTWYEMDKEAGMAFVDGHVIIAPKAALKAAIDTQKGKMKDVTKNSGINDLIKATKTSANVWMVVSLPKAFREEITKGGGLPGDIESGYASIDLKSGLALRVTLNTSSADTATSIAKMATDGLAGAGSDPQLKAMGLDAAVTKLSIKAKDKAVDVSLDLTDKEVEKIKTVVQSMVQGGMR